MSRVIATHTDIDDKILRIDLDCGHSVRGSLFNIGNGDVFYCSHCPAGGEAGEVVPVKPAWPEQRKGVQMPKAEDVLDAIADDYANTMLAQGVVIGAPERIAIRRAANIQLAWYYAMRRVIP
jgi:hypothetical protein